MRQRRIKRARDKQKHSSSQLLNFAPNSYLERTSRPVYAIVFLLPFIVFYEIGTILINTDVLNQSQIRVVAFIWLQNLLEYLGSSGKVAWVAPPFAVVIIMAGLQVASRKSWRFRLGDVWPMAVECILLAIPLIVLSMLLNSPTVTPDDIGPSGGVRRFQQESLLPGSEEAFVAHDSRFEIPDKQQVKGVLNCSSVTKETLPLLAEEAGDDVQREPLLASIVTGIGAGIYEELVFRLILICVLMLLFQDVLGLNHRSSIVLSVLVSAGLFSAHHHIVFMNGQVALSAAFSWTEFGFRTIAGIYFAGLFAIRGFGIAAGTHAFYDIIATIINAAFFSSIN